MTGSFLFCSILPGPAFIPWRGTPMLREPRHLARSLLNVPEISEDYVWQPPTYHTMAGWVRRRLTKNTTAPPGAVP